jgi:uncharacterized protein
VDYPFFPFQIDHLGRTKVTDLGEHIRQLVEQILFTAPGERVNRPSFGCHLTELIFAPKSQELLAEETNIIRSSLTKYLSDLMTIDDVTISSENSALTITVTYIIRKNQLKLVAEFRRGLF